MRVWRQDQDDGRKDGEKWWDPEEILRWNPEGQADGLAMECERERGGKDGPKDFLPTPGNTELPSPKIGKMQDEG